MLNKILATIILFVSSLTTVFASGSFYLGPALTYIDLRSSELTYNGLLPSLHLGYGAWRDEWLYLAVEGFATTSSIRANHGDDENNTFKMSYNYGLSLVPMVNLDDVLFGFARLGVVRTKFKELDEISNAYQLGLGMEGALVSCLNLRGEVDYVKYKSISSVGSLHAMEYTVGLIYRFDSILS